MNRTPQKFITEAVKAPTNVKLLLVSLILMPRHIYILSSFLWYHTMPSDNTDNNPRFRNS